MPDLHGGTFPSPRPRRTIGPGGSPAPAVRRSPALAGGGSLRRAPRTGSGVRPHVPFGHDAISDILEGTLS